MDKIMETLGNFKQFFTWFSDCCPQVKSGFQQLSSNNFWGKWVIFGAVFLRSFWTIRARAISFHFLPEFCFGEEVFPSFSNAVITFETVLFVTTNNSAVLVPAIRAATIWPLLKSDRFTILMNFDNFFWGYQ